jgi:hypothetical protein
MSLFVGIRRALLCSRRGGTLCLLGQLLSDHKLAQVDLVLQQGADGVLDILDGAILVALE